MNYKSDHKAIKSVSKWRYEVALTQDETGIFHVLALNKLVNEHESSSFIDYNHAAYAFDARINSFEGN